MFPPAEVSVKVDFVYVSGGKAELGVIVVQALRHVASL